MLSQQNIEAELSYAYLHAIAVRSGFACSYTTRYLDDAGVDAQIREDGRLLSEDSVHASFTLEIQLKATRVEPIERDGRFPFVLPVHQYDKLRATNIVAPRLLVVLYLPPNPEAWLQHSKEALVARRCAYWVSLRVAPASPNETRQTVYIPCAQVLSDVALTEIMIRCSRQEEMNYDS